MLLEAYFGWRIIALLYLPKPFHRILFGERGKVHTFGHHSFVGGRVILRSELKEEVRAESRTSRFSSRMV